MSLFHSRSSGRLKPAWTYTVDGVIWRLVPASGVRFVGEERDLQKKEVAFFCLDGKTGKPFWEKRSFGERWWTGIEAVHEGTVLLHSFATPDLPEHRGITAVDLQTAELLWEDPELTFLSLQADSVRAFRRTPLGRQDLLLDIRTGAVAGELERDSIPPGNEVSLVLPGLRIPFVAGSIGSEGNLAALLRIAGAANVEAPIERLDIGDLTILGYHDRGSGGVPMERRVAVIDVREGALLFSERTATDVHVVVPDTFIVYDSTLFLLQERRTLVAVNLPGKASLAIRSNS